MSVQTSWNVLNGRVGGNSLLNIVWEKEAKPLALPPIFQVMPQERSNFLRQHRKIDFLLNRHRSSGDIFYQGSLCSGIKVSRNSCYHIKRIILTREEKRRRGGAGKKKAEKSNCKRNLSSSKFYPRYLDRAREWKGMSFLSRKDILHKEMRKKRYKWEINNIKAGGGKFFPPSSISKQGM